MPRTTVYAIRDADTKIRVSYRHRVEDMDELRRKLERARDKGYNVEIYRTTQDLPRQPKGR